MNTVCLLVSHLELDSILIDTSRRSPPTGLAATGARHLSPLGTYRHYRHLSPPRMGQQQSSRRMGPMSRPLSRTGQSSQTTATEAGDRCWRRQVPGSTDARVPSTGALSADRCLPTGAADRCQGRPMPGCRRPVPCLPTGVCRQVLPTGARHLSALPQAPVGKAPVGRPPCGEPPLEGAGQPGSLATGKVWRQVPATGARQLSALQVPDSCRHCGFLGFSFLQSVGLLRFAPNGPAKS